jgi:enoyl-CoA hydratase/carnithine racemase
MEKLIDDTSAQAELGKAVSDVLRAMRESTIPWLAVIDGDCVGASLQLACACDARLASVRTRFGFPPARMDVFPPDHEVVQFAELFGVDGARRLLFSPQLLGFGDPMFDRIATASCEVDVIEAESDRWARHLSGLGRASVAKVKTALRHSVEIVQTRMPPEPTLAFAGPEFLGRWQALKAKRR